MKFKSLWIICLLILSIYTINLSHQVSAQTLGMPVFGDKNPVETLEDIQNQTLSKWQYLGQEWQKILLKKPWINATNNFFIKIDSKKILFNMSIFQIVFGISYSFSLIFWLVAFLWLFVFFWIFLISKPIRQSPRTWWLFIISFFLMFKYRKRYFRMKRIVELYFDNKFLFRIVFPFIFSLIVVILVAQFKLFKLGEIGLRYLVSMKSGTIFEIVIVVGIILGFIILSFMLSGIIDAIKKSKREDAQDAGTEVAREEEAKENAVIPENTLEKEPTSPVPQEDADVVFGREALKKVGKAIREFNKKD